MKAAKDSGEEYYDPTLEDNILGRNRTRLALWEEHLKDPTQSAKITFWEEIKRDWNCGKSTCKTPIVALDTALKCVESSY